MNFIQFSASCSDLQEDIGAQSSVIAQPPNRRKCLGKFETDVDSFDTAPHCWKRVLKTKGIIHRGFGILIALPPQRGAMGQQERQYERDNEGTFTWYRGVEECSPTSYATKAEESLLGS